MQLTASNARTFPIGTSASFFPASVLLNTGSTIGMVSIGVQPNVYSNGTTGVDLSAIQPLVDATWTIETDIPSNLNLNLNLMWTPSSEVNGFKRSLAHISHYDNNQWDMYVTATATLRSDGMYSLPRNSISSLSPFAVFDNTTITGMSQAEAQAGIELYPNPTADVIYVKLTDPSEVFVVEIMDMSGRIVSRSELNADQNSISLQALNEGSYFVRMHNSDSSIIKKVVKL
jgi:hypothetical protein